MDASWDGEVLHTILGSLVTVTLTSDLVSKNCIESDADLLYSLRIPNLVCGCILGWWSVVFHLLVTVTLTFDLVFRIIVSGA